MSTDPALAAATLQGSRNAITDKELSTRRGYSMLLLVFVILLLSGAAIAVGRSPSVIVAGAAGLVVTFFMLFGFFILQPNESLVGLLFGDYRGTEHRAGFWWINPFSTKKKVSRRLATLECGPLKVNDAVGNPIDIGAVVVWRVEDAAKALLEVGSYEGYVKAQSETALRRMASSHPYDHVEAEEAAKQGEALTGTAADTRRLASMVTLRDGGDEVSESLLGEIRSRMRPVGIAVDEARITHLAYSSEIAGAMLRKQAASAVVAARRMVVKGAVSIVEDALSELARKGLAEGIDADRRAAMVSNLLVVLVSDHEVHPVINTGAHHV